ncbi:hypothetical protein [Lactobacillus phage LL-H]|uniref:hypothetical protein n=1 Tax=Lactococcus phage LL-H TaxID=12348 RepID=UPI0000F6E469|nr:hypothetical protein LPLLH_ORF149 [Lactobacillus phage LL-H]ABO60922.1 hypothetical protein [Lactobacillus phage LL-H]
MAVIMPLIRSITPLTPSATYSLIPFQISRTIDFIPFQASLKIFLMSFQTSFQLPLRMSVPSLRISVITLSSYLRKSLITSQAVLRIVPIDFHVTRQSVFIKPIAAFTRALIVVMANRTKPTITSSRGDITTNKILSVPVITFTMEFQAC